MACPGDESVLNNTTAHASHRVRRRTSLLYLWRVGLQGQASAIRKGGPHPFHRHSSRKRQGEHVASAAHITPPRWTVYTAGSCEQDSGSGGWAYVQLGDGTAREENGEHLDTTTIRMELTAAIRAVAATQPGSTVLVYTGSQLVQQGITVWVHKWLHSGWRTGTGEPVENRDLWEKLRHLDEERRVRWEWLDVPRAEATAGQPRHRHGHALVDAQRRRAAVHATGAHADSQGDEIETRVHREDSVRQREAGTQHLAPAVMNRGNTQPRTDDRPQALMAECQALERRWAAVHEEALHLDQEWQRLVSMLTSRVEAQRNGQPPSWMDGALMFSDLDKHAARTSSLAHEALQICHHFALALQGALDAMAEG
jgi:ribonuclease HI